MAIICSLCGKKQSGWIEDYSLAPHLQEYRICASCHAKLNNLCKNNNSDSEEKKFFSQLLVTNQYPEEVKSLLAELLDSNSSSKTPEEISQQLKDVHNREIDSIQLTSGFNFENHAITKYHGFISSETALGMGIFKGIAASITNVLGTESGSLKSILKEAKENVIYDLKLQAHKNGANAIIGMSINYTMFADSIVGVIVSGTAVTIN